MFVVPPQLQGQTLAAVLRKMDGKRSWTDARRLITTRRVRVNGNLSLDDARRLSAGETIEVRGQSDSPPPRRSDIVVRHIDADLIIVEKPPGIQTIRRPEERNWSDQRKAAQPTLDELVARFAPSSGRVRVVHRLDRDTSGLMLFALSPIAQERLIGMFAEHKINRVYTAIAHGQLGGPQTLDTILIRDRGDGLRGRAPSGYGAADARRAITHVRPIEKLSDSYTVVECRLETGRTHQIRIHLSEIGHRLCGEKIYTHGQGERAAADTSSAPRMALHSTTLRLIHPITQHPLEFDCPLPQDLSSWLGRLRQEMAGKE